MEQVIRIGLDTSKQVFQVHGVDAAERVVLRRQVRRSELARFFGGLAPTLIGLEACGASHHWARVLAKLGHEVRLVPPSYVKTYRKGRNKNDARDAEAICEALGRPSMRFVPVKTEAQQAALMLHSARELLTKQRTMLVNAIRGHAAEFGIVGAQGLGKLSELLERVRSSDIPEPARAMLELLASQIDPLDRKLREIDSRLRKWFSTSPESQRLASIPGVGLVTATALAMKIPDPGAFRSGRHLAAWLGLTPSQRSTAGKHRLGKISRQGDETLRSLLIVGATAVVRWARPGRASPWLLQLLARKPRKLVAVALANKTARIAWAIMMRGEMYRRAMPI
jgi:transposase